MRIAGMIAVGLMILGIAISYSRSTTLQPHEPPLARDYHSIVRVAEPFPEPPVPGSRGEHAVLAAREILLSEFDIEAPHEWTNEEVQPPLNGDQTWMILGQVNGEMFICFLRDSDPFALECLSFREIRGSPEAINRWLGPFAPGRNYHD